LVARQRLSDRGFEQYLTAVRLPFAPGHRSGRRGGRRRRQELRGGPVVGRCFRGAMVERYRNGRARVEGVEVTLSWLARRANLDLHLMSPSGRHYAAYADTTGYSGDTNPKTFRVPNPEAGTLADLGGGHARIRAYQFWGRDVGVKRPPARVALAWRRASLASSQPWPARQPFSKSSDNRHRMRACTKAPCCCLF